jgi:hypothetical protein
MDLNMEFVEQGIVRVVSLIDRHAVYKIALRAKEVCEGSVDARGFDLFALSAPSQSVLDELAARCDRLGIAHSAIHEFPNFGAGMDSPGPDGIVVRVVWSDPSRPPYVGSESDGNGEMPFI